MSENTRPCYPIFDAIDVVIFDVGGRGTIALYAIASCRAEGDGVRWASLRTPTLSWALGLDIGSLVDELSTTTHCNVFTQRSMQCNL
jgi:hypothetical protein